MRVCPVVKSNVAGVRLVEPATRQRRGLRIFSEEVCA
jgi:hypothetical protein